MAQDRQTGSPRDDWYKALARFACDCAEMPASEEVRLLDEFYRHLASAPLASALKPDELPNEAEFVAMLGAGASETAALRLIGQDCGYMLSRGPGGLFFASIVLPGQSEESSAGGDSLALALTGALALALAQSSAGLGGPADPELRPALRFN